MKRLLYAVSLLLTVVLLAGCAQEVRLLDETKLKDLSLLSGEPCEAPCWNGIVPGETVFRDAKLMIEENACLPDDPETESQADSDASQVSLQDTCYTEIQEAEREEGSDARIFGFAPAEGQVCCQVFSRDGETTTSLLLQFAPVMSLGPVMDRYGEPLYLGGEAPAAEQAYMALVYPQVPMVVYVFVAGAETGRLSTSSEVLGAMYLAPDEMDLLLACSRLYDWQGFGAFNDSIDENFDFIGEAVENEEICGSA